MVDTRIRILRSNNQLHLASLFSSPAWCPIDEIWYAWVQWNEDGTNPMVRKDKSYQKSGNINIKKRKFSEVGNVENQEIRSEDKII